MGLKKCNTLVINRRNSWLLGIGSSDLNFLPLLTTFVYEIVQFDVV